MSTQKYSVNQHQISIFLSWIKSGEIAIPEIQRPFVWDGAKVRDLIDSLFQGYPIGYVITWRNQSVRLKDGTNSAGKRILIDGQQRITALMTSILGYEIINQKFKKGKIVIAFHPLEERFEVSNVAIENDRTWIKDISTILDNSVDIFKIVEKYCENNNIADRGKIFSKISKLQSINNSPIGVIDLDSELDIETVTEIFIRINSQGVVLSQADFVMSKIAANETYGGHELRKCIDYFSHLAIAPEFYSEIVKLDKDFCKTEYFKKMTWLKDEIDDIYDPSYTDMLRVSFTSQFKRGRLQDLVSLLSGRNFETRTNEETIIESSYEKLKSGIFNFMNETNFKRFVMIVRSAGFITSDMIRSQNVLNFAYILFLIGRTKKIDASVLERTVRKWLVFSILTGRYSGSPESMFDLDVRRIEEEGFIEYTDNTINSELSETYWNEAIPLQMNTSVTSSPYFNVYRAAQVKLRDFGFLSRDITVHELIAHRGDIHHVFPRNYLKGHGLTRGKYNQIANYVTTQSEINISISDISPNKYFSDLMSSVEKGKALYGGIDNKEELMQNLKINCIPEGIENMDINDYENFLVRRRKLMAQKMKKYFYKL